MIETLLDLLELYTHHRGATIVGPNHPVEKFLTIRIPLNQEADAKKLPRFTSWKEKKEKEDRDTASLNGSATAKSKHHGREPSPATKDKEVNQNPLKPVSATADRPKPGERGREGTVRFMLDPERAESEKREVAEYFKVEMEEYEVED